MATTGLSREFTVALVSISLVLYLSSMLSAAQATQLGTVENLNQDNGFITISGKTLKFSDKITRVFLDGKQVGVEVLNPGMIIRYSLDSTATLVTVELLGPVHQLRLLLRN